MTTAGEAVKGPGEATGDGKSRGHGTGVMADTTTLSFVIRPFRRHRVALAMTFKSLINVLGRMREGKLGIPEELATRARTCEEMPSGLLATSVTQ